jgi:A/G-specific adenine glycosylase
MGPDSATIVQFQTGLLSWWENNARDFSWRRDRSAYRTAIAELMLRRTRASQVEPVYSAYMAKYPTVEDAAEAAPEAMADILYPLGLAWRAKDIHNFVKEAHEQYGEELPMDVELLSTLPGVGNYVSAAIACFAGNKPVPIIDVNVTRVLGRFFRIRYDAEARRRKEMIDLAAQCVLHDSPASYHYALLDFAAKVCTARKQSCTQCPLNVSCAWYVKRVSLGV